MKTTIAHVSLGSNLGNRAHNLAVACEYIEHIPNTTILSSSRIYYTEPQGVKQQPWFANQVVKVAVQGISPITFLNELLKIEILMGRERKMRWGPRIIDLDLLVFGDEIMDSSHLTLPHPRILERAFVMVPLLEVSPSLVLPTGESIREEIKKLTYCQMGDRIWQK